MKAKIKYIIIIITITMISKVFSQNDSLLFGNNTVQIYKSRALFMNNTIYDAVNDFERLREMEETDECKVDYSFYYNPLSLVGEYYSYEFGEGGILACGVPGNSLGIKTIDLNSRRKISLNEIFTEESIVKALKSDKWIQKIAKERDVDFSGYNTLKEYIDAINQLGYAEFNSSGFTILGYSEEKNEVAIRFVGEAYMGFNHNQHLQLGLLLIPKTNFKDKLLNKTEFVLNDFENGLTN